MAKILFVCLLAVTAISAMPVADEDPHRQLSVVPLEKTAEPEKPLLRQAQEIITDAAQPNEQLRLAEEKPDEVIISKKSEEKKPEELKPEEKKPEEPKPEDKKPAELLSQKPKEETKIEEPKKIEEKKPEESLKAASSEHVSATVESQNIKELVEPAVASGTESVIPIVEGVVAEHAQAKKIDEHESVDKNLLKSNAEKPAIEGVKTEEKPDRVTREAEEAAKGKIAVESKLEEEKKPLEKAAEKIEPLVAAEEKQAASPVALIAEEKIKVNNELLAEEKKSKGIQVAAGVAVLAEAASGLSEVTQKEAEKPAELTSIPDTAKTIAEPTAATKTSETKNESQQAQEISKEQRSEDVPVEATKVAQDVGESHPAAIHTAAIEAEQEKIIPAVAEKSSKSAGELKSDDFSTENPANAMGPLSNATLPDLKLAEEEKKIEKPIEMELKKDAIKEEEKKKEDSSEEDSSEEKKKEQKEEKKEMSEEKKESSEEDSNEKKDEKKMEAKKPELLAEPTTKAPSS